MDLASPAVSGTSVYANGLSERVKMTTMLHLVPHVIMYAASLLHVFSSRVEEQLQCILITHAPHKPYRKQN